MLKWIFLVRYPDGVTLEEGEAWYFDFHVKEARGMVGLRGYRTWALQPATTPGAGRSLEMLNRWARMTELTFDDFAAWQHAMDNLPTFTPAPWADTEAGVPSYVGETIFVGDEPVDLLAPVDEAP